MSNDLEATILSQLEALNDRVNSMAPVSVSSNVFVDALNTDFYSCAAILKHVNQVRLEAVIRSRFNSNGHTFGSTLLRVNYGFLNIR